jgi:hypothetical protein
MSLISSGKPLLVSTRSSSMRMFHAAHTLSVSLTFVTSGLSLGQMVHPTSFTLMDSMACISIADPRMDSGIDPLPEDLIPVSDRTRFDEPIPDFNPHKALSLFEVTWVIDRLFACEVRYHIVVG